MLGAYRRAISHLCLHDAAILSDTIRENLFAPDASEAECWRALAAVELDGRIEAQAGSTPGSVRICSLSEKRSGSTLLARCSTTLRLSFSTSRSNIWTTIRLRGS